MSSGTAGLLQLIGLHLLTRGSVICCYMGIPSVCVYGYLKPAWPILYGSIMLVM